MSPTVAPDADWTEPEKWVWEQVCKGDRADLNARYGQTPDPKIASGWAEERLLRVGFLETILLRSPYKDALTRHGVRIIGAWIKEKLDLSNARLTVEWWLDKSRLEEEVDLSRVQTMDLMSLEGSFFARSLNLNNFQTKDKIVLNSIGVANMLYLQAANIEKDLLLNHVECGGINLHNARIGMELRLSAARVRETLNMDGLILRGDLYMDDHAEFAEISMNSTDIGGQLLFKKARVSRILDASGLLVKLDLFLDESEFEELSMIGGVISGQLHMKKVIVKAAASMNDTIIRQNVFMGGSEFASLDMTGCMPGAQLDMSNVTVIGDMELTGAGIGGELWLSGTTVGGKLYMESIDVKRDINAFAEAVFGEIDMQFAQVHGNLDFSNAKVRKALVMSKISVAGSVYLRGHSVFSNVRMIGGKIGNTFELVELQVDEDTDIQSIVVGQNVYFWKAQFTGTVKFLDSVINGWFIASSSAYSFLDLGGTRIQGELEMGNAKGVNTWTGVSCVNLRNVQVGALSDGGVESWPANVDLDGLAYTSLSSGSRGDGSNDIVRRHPAWLMGWLAKVKPFSTQPYNQLAEALKRAGYGEKASGILYASRNREQEMARKDRQYVKWFGLTLLKWTIGYGYGIGYFRSLIWVVFLTALGVCVISTVPTGAMHGASLLDRIGFSLDLLVPVIQLNDKYKIDFHGWQQIYFYIHKILGFVLSSFVAAGLAGITKR